MLSSTQFCRRNSLRLLQLRSEATVSAEKAEAQKKANFDPSRRPKVVKIDPSVRKRLEKGVFFGKAHQPVIHVPESVTAAINHVLQNERSDVRNRMLEYASGGMDLRNFLFSRKAPLNGRMRTHLVSSIDKRARNLHEGDLPADYRVGDEVNLETKIQKTIRNELKRKHERWWPVEYSSEAAWGYICGTKAAMDYASVFMVLSEIKRRKKLFKPKTLFDFGSGVGSVSWAVRETFGDMSEYFNVDASTAMNDMSRMIINRSEEDCSLPAGHSYRLRIPRDNAMKYDLVTCAYTLLDLASENERLATIESLWNKTEPGGFLILVEVGTNAGFQVIAEARHLLLQLAQFRPETDPDESASGYLFSPCPHSLSCPRYANDVVPCNFTVRYRNMPLIGMTPQLNDAVHQDLFTYLVFHKDDGETAENYPRLVEEPLRRHNHIICRMCTKNGLLEEVVAVKGDKKENYEKSLLYKYAQKLHRNDRLCVDLADK